MLRRHPVLAALVLACLLLPSTQAWAGEPPNQNDPCSRAGKDSCGTAGVGAYKTYKYGVRWFGDYRGAIPGYRGASFCIDLRYWYPSKAFGYQERSAAGLENRDGEGIPAASLRRMNYAAWTYGRSTNKAQQGAVMLYVHGLMGDGAPGEVAPKAVGLNGTYTNIAREAARLAGPYKLTTSLPEKGTVGKAVRYSVKLTAASGAPVPGVDVKLATTGARGAPTTLTTGANGTASVTLTPSSADQGLEVDATTEPLPSALPRLFTPTKGAAVGSGQRLVVPAAEPVEARAATGVSEAQVKISTAATPGTLLVGEQTQDEVTASGVDADYRAPATVKLFGPARTADTISCDGPPAFETQTTLKGGKTLTPLVTPTRPGYYGYQLVVADVDGVKGVTTPCAEPTERIKVETQPAVVTQVSTPSLQPGAPLSDTLAVSGLNGETVPIQAALYGPFASMEALNCDGAPAWTGTVDAPGDGTYQTAPTQLTVPGYYTYRESIQATDLVRAYTAPCGVAAETAIVRGAPAIRTQISAQATAPGAQVTDSVVVTGLGALTADVQVQLHGPFPTPEAIRCDGTPFHTSVLTGVGDGTHQTEPVTLGAAGYYTYVEQIAGTAAHDATATQCGEAAETTLAKATPAVTTVVSDAVARPGARITDTIDVTGAGTTPLQVEVQLFGPFRTRGAISCAGKPLASRTVTLPGDGSHVSPQFTLPEAGFYTFREVVADEPLVKGVTTPCAEESETSLGVPLIPTGRGSEQITFASTPLAPKGKAPARVVAAGLGVDAKVYGVDIDTRAGVLAIPKDIGRVGWWRDGASLGDKTGTVLLAGHVDSAARGAGAFYGLQRARPGQRVKVTDATGKVRTFRVTTRKVIVKDQLPLGIFTRKGPPRLVLVTCGGPFDQAAGSYRDNVVVTAVPV